MAILYKKFLRTVASLLAIGFLLTLNACEDRLSPNPNGLTDATIYALNDANQLLRLNIRSSSVPLATMHITGTNIQMGERILSIDFRPATGQLYGVSNKSRLFVINTATAEARPLTAAPFRPGIGGSIIGMDFNPTIDRIRIISDNGQDLRVNPETGMVIATSGSVKGTSGIMVSEGAYTNNHAGATAAILYDIDPATDRLYTRNPLNNSVLTDAGPLGLDIAGAAGFDIAPDGTGLVAVTFNGSSELEQINLSTGRLQKLGNLPGTIIGLAIPTDPVAYALDSTNNLLIFNPSASTPAIITKALTGLQPGETLLGIDFRPVNGQLYALGSTNRLYTLNTSNGVTTLVGKGAFTTLLSGNVVDFDFNPSIDRIRVTTSKGQNVHLNPTDGTLADLDASLNSAPSKLPTSAYALMRTNDSTRVYSINLTNGSYSSGVLLPGNPAIRGFAVGLGF